MPGGFMRERVMVRYTSRVLCVGVALLTSACMVTTEQFQALQQDVRSLRGDLNAVTKDRAAGGGQPGGDVSRSLVARLEELAVETRMVQGQFEETNFRLSEVSQRLDETELKMARLLGESGRPGGGLPPGQAPLPPTAPSPAVPGGTPGARPERPLSPSGPAQSLPPRGPGGSLPQAPTVTTPEKPIQGSLPSPEEVYKKALSDYTKGNYDLAISGFKSYLNFFPKTSLVPNAQYWLAESYYSKGRDAFPLAIREFDKLIKEFPDSSRVPSAMLKKGYAYLELKEAAQGQAVLRELMAKFPNSREARLAQDSLERLR
jgi:tol-pal system protein YbgF